MKLLLVFVIATLGTACVKQISDVGPQFRLTAPRIRLTSPYDFQRFHAGDTVSIVAKITDNEQLERVRLFVINRATGLEVLRLEKYVEVKSYNLSASFNPEAGPRYTIKIEAMDRNNNEAETRIEVSCN